MKNNVYNINLMGQSLYEVYFIVIIIIFPTVNIYGKMPTAFSGSDTLIALGGGIEYQYAHSQIHNHLPALDITFMYGFLDIQECSLTPTGT